MYFFISLGFSSFYTLAPESFPTDIRGTGMAFANIIGRSGGAICPIIIGLLLTLENGFQYSMGLLISFSLTMVLCVSFLKETRVVAVSVSNNQDN